MAKKKSPDRGSFFASDRRPLPGRPAPIRMAERLRDFTNLPMREMKVWTPIVPSTGLPMNFAGCPRSIHA